MEPLWNKGGRVMDRAHKKRKHRCLIKHTIFYIKDVWNRCIWLYYKHKIIRQSIHRTDQHKNGYIVNSNQTTFILLAPEKFTASLTLLFIFCNPLKCKAICRLCLHMTLKKIFFRKRIVAIKSYIAKAILSCF